MHGSRYRQNGQLLINFGKPPALPGDSSRFDRSRGRTSRPPSRSQSSEPPVGAHLQNQVVCRGFGVPSRELGRRTMGLPKVPADSAQQVVALAALGGSWFYGPFEGLT